MTPQPQHLDILDAGEQDLKRPFYLSLGIHGLVLAAVIAGGVFKAANTQDWGSLDAGGGAIGIAVENSIPLPQASGRKNPVANDTDSEVPTPPAKMKARPKVETPPPDAIPIKSKNAPKKYSQAASQPNKWREQQEDRPNQLYTPGGQSLSSNMYQMTGGGGVGVGTNSPFGVQFGWYATLLRDQVARIKASNQAVQAQTRFISDNKAVMTTGSVSSVSPGVKLCETSASTVLRP